MKKLLSILLAIVMIFSLVACSNNNNDIDELNNNDTSIVKPNDDIDNDGTDDDAQKPQDIQWELKDDVSVNVPDVKIKKYKVDGIAEEFEIAISVYDFAIDELYETIASNEYVKNNYQLDSKTYWEEHGFLDDYELDSKEKVYGTHYKIGEYITSRDDAEKRLFAGIGRDTYEFANNDGFYITFGRVDINKETQEGALSVLTDVVGEEMANYLVYAKDKDAKKYNDNELDNEYQLYEKFTSGIFEYVIERKINISEYNNEVTFSIDIHVDDYQMNWLMENSYDYESRYDEMKYHFEDVFPIMGQIDATNHTDIFKDYYLIGSEDKYQFSSVDDLALSYNYSEYGNEFYDTYHASLTTNKTDQGSYFKNETLTLAYYCDDVNGSLLDLSIEIDGDIEFDDELESDKVVSLAQDLVQKKLTYILPELKLDLSGLKAGEKNVIKGTYSHELVKGTWDYELTVDLTCTYDNEICFDFEWRSDNALEE